MTNAQQTENCCILCNGRGYIQLLLGGTETCVECHGESQWLGESARTEKKVQIELVHLKLV